MSIGNGLVKLLAVVLASGCAHAQGTVPQDMSVVGHEQAARVEQEEAKQDEEKAQEDSGSEASCAGGIGDLCGNSNDEYAMLAARHRKLAAQHRAVSQALRDAEAKACVGVTGDSRDMSPFALADGIRAVMPLQKPSQKPTYGGLEDENTVGATVVLYAAPGLTAEWLQTVVDCHLARNAALGFPAEPMGYCPLNIPNITATVRSVGNGFAVDIQSNDSAAVKEILKRASALKAPASEPSKPAGAAGTLSPPAP